MALKEQRIEWHAKTRSICQIPKEGLEYALVSDDFKQIHQLVWCKDFMQDAIYGFVNQKRMQIYGFEYDPATYPAVCTKQTRIIVANWKDADFGTKLLTNCLPFLHDIERQLKMRKTVVVQCSDPPQRYKRCGIYLLLGSKRWMCAPPMISLYTLLIRVGMVHKPEQSAMNTLEQVKNRTLPSYNHHHMGGDDDAGLVDRSLTGIKRILTSGDRKVFHKKMEGNYPAANHNGTALSVYTIHDSCGMVGFSKGYTKSDFPFWHKN